MSFILDALKKSESERQRQSGPALFEVKIAPPRSRFAAWGAAIAVLLAINFVVVGFVLWRGSASRAAPAGSAAASVAPTIPTPQPVPPQSGARSTAPGALAASERFGARTETGGGAPAAAGAPATVAVEPPSSAAAQGAIAAPAGTPAHASAGDAGANPDDLAPAVEPRRTPAPAPATSGVIRATESGLPTYQDAAAEPGANIPTLSLDLHVYAPQADQRFVFLNMLKLREGDTSPQGVRVERITPDGVILSYQGKEFVLQRH